MTLLITVITIYVVFTIIAFLCYFFDKPNPYLPYYGGAALKIDDELETIDTSVPRSNNYYNHSQEGSRQSA